MGQSAVENELGCGLIGGIFHRRSFYPRKTSVRRSLPTNSHTNVNKISSTHNSDKQQQQQQQGSSDKTMVQDPSSLAKPPPRPSTTSHNHQNQSRRPSDASRKPSLDASRRPSSDASRSSTSSSNNSTLTKVSSQGQDIADLNRLRREVSGNSTNLSIIIHNREQSNGSKSLVRATSGNIMLSSHLGNLRQSTGNVSSRTANQKSITPNYKNGSNGSSTGNIIRSPRCSGGPMSKKNNPELLKNMGNEEYNKGRFEEALILYNQAIAIDPSKAVYHSNKAACLTGLGRLIEAVFECREVIRIEPYYHGAHHRLATLYLRLGEAEKALCHYKYSSPKADSDYIAQAQALQTHLNKCSEALELRDWKTLLKETQWAISSGVDSAPQIYALQADALLKLHRHQEAYATFLKRPNVDINSCIEFFGPDNCAYLLIIQAQLYMSMGRLEDGVASAQHAARLDLTNKEVSMVLRRIRAVASARLRGNHLFKSSKFSEACAAYSEGLEHDPYNSLLLCNRAACWSKLGKFEKAIEDCNAALDVRPTYSKARLRRANCNAKLERWEASIQDYEMLIRETPGDEEVGRALFEAQVQLKKQNGEDTTGMKFGSNLVLVNSNERFRHFTTSPGMSVVLFCNKSCNKQVLQLLAQVCKRFPSVNFLKVEIEDHPYLVKSEGVSSIPAFEIYKNGSRIKEIPGNNCEMLEDAVKLYSS